VSFDYPRRMMLTAIIATLVCILIMAALWLPKIPRDVKVMDALFVVDITDSMNVEDVSMGGESVSRLDWTKEFLRQTLLEMPCGSHAGLAIFSEARSLILMNPVEVCDTYHDLVQMLGQLNTYMAWARSSEVSKATYTAIKQAKSIDPQPTVVFITDGHEAPPVHESLFPKFPGKPGEVHGLMVGVGGEDLLPIPKTNEDGVIDGVWGVNDVMHQDVYASLQGGGNQNKPRTEHLSSQKVAHLETLAHRVGFGLMSSPTKPQLLVKAIEDEAVTRKQRIDYDFYPLLSLLALVLMLSMFMPYQRLIGLISRKR
jgi:mxaL protein